jgi:sterol desaturase/sphingolipid hydroxylase (fatty acid hydroxylase superfamily)
MLEESFLLTHEPLLRLGSFAGVFVAVALWELAAPRRERLLPRARRWPANLVLAALNTLVLRAVVPFAAVGMATFAAHKGMGLFNHFDVPAWTLLPLSIIALDLAVWLQHVMFHAIPALWRLHRVHHADLDIDLTTGARFHPIEMVLSTLIKLAVVALIGAPVAAVVLFEVLLSATALFSHADINISPRVERWLRWVVVTPDMHRVHHSVQEHETNSNFGFNIPCWDRLFGTYLDQPHGGHDGMTIGIHGHRDPHDVARLSGMLMLPFHGGVGGYGITHRDWRDEHAAR